VEKRKIRGRAGDGLSRSPLAYEDVPAVYWAWTGMRFRTAEDDVRDVRGAKGTTGSGQKSREPECSGCSGCSGSGLTSLREGHIRESSTDPEHPEHQDSVQAPGIFPPAARPRFVRRRSAA